MGTFDQERILIKKAQPVGLNSGGDAHLKIYLFTYCFLQYFVVYCFYIHFEDAYEQTVREQ